MTERVPTVDAPERDASGTATPRRSLLRELIRPYRSRIAALAILSFLGGATEALFLVVVTRTGLAIADGIDRAELLLGKAVSFNAALGIAAGLLAIRLAFALLGVRLSSSMAFELLTGLRRRLADDFLQASWATQQSQPAGQLQYLSGLAANATAVVNALSTSVAASLSLASLILIALLVNPWATLTVVVALGVLGGVLSPIRNRIRARTREAASELAAYNRALAELGTLGLEMQTLGAAREFSDHLGQLSIRDGAARRRVLRAQGSLAPIYTALAYFAILGALGLVEVVGAGGLPAVGAVMLVMLRSLSYGQQLQGTAGALSSSMPYLEVLFATLDRYEANRAVSGSMVPGAVAPITVDHVSFAYQGGRKVLNDVSFTIERNEIIGVIGPSGSGKSTLIQLLLGLHEPTAGAIRVAGIDLREVDRSAWLRSVAFVPQDAQLVTGTVADNIRFFRPGINDQAIASSAAQARLTQDLAGMPHGLETFLGERGAQLSGGQRQRVSIARALATRPDLLVLDEPTSALDAGTESEIREMMAQLRGRTTIVVIAHRMSTLDICDRILVLEQGRLTACGRPDVLSETNAFYRHALNLSGFK